MRGGFISVNEEKPANDLRVLVWNAKFMFGFIAYRTKEEWYNHLGSKVPDSIISHWFKIDLTEKKEEQKEEKNSELSEMIDKMPDCSNMPVEDKHDRDD